MQIGKISGAVDKTVVPDNTTIDQEIEDAKALAVERCIAAGGNSKTIEVVEVDVIPMSYVTNGATRILVRVVGDLVDDYEEIPESTDQQVNSEGFQRRDVCKKPASQHAAAFKGTSYEIEQQVDLKAYRPKIKGDLWYLSEIDLQFLQDGTGVLAVGSCGEPYPAYIACLLALQNGEDITIRRQDTLPDDAVVLVAGFMVSSPIFAVL